MEPGAVRRLEARVNKGESPTTTRHQQRPSVDLLLRPASAPLFSYFAEMVKASGILSAADGTRGSVFSG